jgi:hypothetical protein
MLMDLFNELIELSLKEKRGLTIFIGGQTVAGIVVRVIGTEGIEVRSQMYSRVIIRMDAVDAMALT